MIYGTLSPERTIATGPTIDPRQSPTTNNTHATHYIINPAKSPAITDIATTLSTTLSSTINPILSCIMDCIPTSINAAFYTQMQYDAKFAPAIVN